MKKILALAVALCTVFAVGCGVGEKDSETETSSDGAQKTAEAVAVAEEKPEEDPAGEVDETEEEAGEKEIFSELTEEERVELNKFISNFTEALCDESVNYDAESKISFAFHHVFINGIEGVAYVGDMMGIKAEKADEILNRFFGESVPHESTDGGYWTYEDGYFLMPAASGETYAYFAIATGMTDNGDGTYTVEFNEYFDPEAWEYPVSAWYSLDAETATARYDLLGSHKAIVKPKRANNKDTYEMIEFKC